MGPYGEATLATFQTLRRSFHGGCSSAITPGPRAGRRGVTDLPYVATKGRPARQRPPFPRVSRVGKFSGICGCNMTVALLEQVATSFCPRMPSAVTGPVGGWDVMADAEVHKVCSPPASAGSFLRRICRNHVRAPADLVWRPRRPADCEQTHIA